MAGDTYQWGTVREKDENGKVTIANLGTSDGDTIRRFLGADTGFAEATFRHYDKTYGLALSETAAMILKGDGTV